MMSASNGGSVAITVRIPISRMFPLHQRLFAIVSRLTPDEYPSDGVKRIEERTGGGTNPQCPLMNPHPPDEAAISSALATIEG
jgi:hypothetical protein